MHIMCLMAVFMLLKIFNIIVVCRVLNVHLLKDLALNLPMTSRNSSAVKIRLFYFQL